MSDLFTKVALKGDIHKTWQHKYGATKVLGMADTNEMIWNGGGDYTGFPNESETLSIVSGSASDTAKTLTIEGLDADFEPLTETVTLTGQTPVLTTGVFHRAARAFISSGALNLGEITINHSSTTANIFAVLPIGYGQTQICAFTVPNNMSCLIKGIDIRLSRTSGAAGSALVSFRVRENGETAFRGRTIGTITTSSAAAGVVYSGGIFITEKSDIKIIIETISDNVSFFTGEIEYLLMDNGETD